MFRCFVSLESRVSCEYQRRVVSRPTKKRMGSLPTWRPGASFRLRNASDSFERPKNICRIAASSSRKGPSVTPVPFKIVRALEFDSVCVYLGV